MINFGEYLPDLPAYKNPGCTVAQNVISTLGGYRSFPSSEVYTNALAARCQGATVTKDDSGTVHHFAGDATALYNLSSTTWTDISKTGGYSLLTDEQWAFAQFGNYLFATNIYDTLQYIQLGGSIFADVSGAPQARAIAAIGNFLVVGNTYDSTNDSVPNKIRWSAIGNSLSWPTPGTDAATQVQAGEQDLPTGRAVRAIVGGEYGTIIMDDAIYRMTYEGPPTFFRFDEIENGRGTQAPQSVASFGKLIFYLSDDGFYMFDGEKSIPIGANKIDKTFYNEFDTDYFYRVSATIDPRERTVMWAAPVTGHTGGRPNKIYIYNWKNNRWTTISDEVDVLLKAAAPSYTLEELDTVSLDLDALTPSMDSGQWLRGAPRLSSFKSDFKMYNYTGTAMDATIETREDEVFDGRRAEVQKLRPIVDGGTTTVTIGTRNLLSGTVSYGSELSLNSNGEADARSEARYHRFRVKTTGSFNHSQGVELIEAVQTGVR